MRTRQQTGKAYKIKKKKKRGIQPQSMMSSCKKRKGDVRSHQHSLELGQFDFPFSSLSCKHLEWAVYRQIHGFQATGLSWMFIKSSLEATQVLVLGM